MNTGVCSHLTVLSRGFGSISHQEICDLLPVPMDTELLLLLPGSRVRHWHSQCEANRVCTQNWSRGWLASFVIWLQKHHTALGLGGLLHSFFLQVKVDFFRNCYKLGFKSVTQFFVLLSISPGQNLFFQALKMNSCKFQLFVYTWNDLISIVSWCQIRVSFSLSFWLWKSLLWWSAWI